MQDPSLEKMAMDPVRDSFRRLVHTVAAGRRILVSRRRTAMAALLPKDDYTTLTELDRRDQQLAAVLRGRGIIVEPWTTANVVEVLARIGERS